MAKGNPAQEIKHLQQRVSELELKLIQTQQALDSCLGQPMHAEEEKNKQHSEPISKTKAKTKEKDKERQNKLFSLSKLCDANWSAIPEGLISAPDDENELIKMPRFKMLNTPVTFEMFDLYCASTGQQPPGDNSWGRANRPVINVNYQDALTYSRWLSELTGWHCRLTTEEQWEYACPAGSVTDYWYGDVPDPRMMVMGTGKTMPTPGPRLANEWDLYDMHGNVWEWTSTAKGDEYILCGGSWYNKANWLTSRARNISYPDFSNDNWGFRLIRQDK